MKAKKIILLTIIAILSAGLLAGCDSTALSIPSVSGQVINDVVAFIADIAALGAAAAFVTLLIQVLKLVKIVKEDTAKMWSMALNALLLAGLVVMKIVDPSILAADLNETFQVIMSAAFLIFGYLGIQLPTSEKLYQLNKGTPYVGYSISDDK